MKKPAPAAAMASALAPAPADTTPAALPATGGSYTIEGGTLKRDGEQALNAPVNAPESEA